MSDQRGVGIGSTLAELKAACPGGGLIVGNEDGRRYANFVSHYRAVFEMDMDALPQACFHDESVGCDMCPDLRCCRRHTARFLHLLRDYTYEISWVYHGFHGGHDNFFCCNPSCGRGSPCQSPTSMRSQLLR